MGAWGPEAFENDLAQDWLARQRETLAASWAQEMLKMEESEVRACAAVFATLLEIDSGGSSEKLVPFVNLCRHRLAELIRADSDYLKSWDKGSRAKVKRSIESLIEKLQPHGDSQGDEWIRKYEKENERASINRVKKPGTRFGSYPFEVRDLEAASEYYCRALDLKVQRNEGNRIFLVGPALQMIGLELSADPVPRSMGIQFAPDNPEEWLKRWKAQGVRYRRGPEGYELLDSDGNCLALFGFAAG